VYGPGGVPKPTAQQSAVIPFIGGLLEVIAIVVITMTMNGTPTKQGSLTPWSSRANPPLARGPGPVHQITIPRMSTNTRPVTDSTVSMIDHDLMV
jgi:hypothetical protein